jgi:hypothetical protein
MSMIIWTVAAFMVGIGVYLVGPLVAAPLLPDWLRRRAANWYWRQACVVADRPRIVDLDQGSHTIIATDYRAEWGDEGSLNGEKGHWEDPLSSIGYAFGRPIGLVPERLRVICHPKYCEIGREKQRQVTREEARFSATSGDRTLTVHESNIQLDDQHQLVDADDIVHLLGDAADPWLGQDTYEYMEKSQAGFGSRSVIELMTFILAYMAPIGLFWFISEGGGGVSTSVSLWVMVL